MSLHHYFKLVSKLFQLVLVTTDKEEEKGEDTISCLEEMCVVSNLHSVCFAFLPATKKMTNTILVLICNLSYSRIIDLDLLCLPVYILIVVLVLKYP